VTARVSLSPPPPPRKTVATRVLVSFAVVLVAFVVTVGFSIAGQRQAALGAEELAKGYMPVALRLGELRAVQATLSSLIEQSPTERDPSARITLEMLLKVRRASFAEARAAVAKDMRDFGSDETRELALLLTGEIEGIEASLSGERLAFDRLLDARERGDFDASQRALLAIMPMEIDCTRRLRGLSDRIAAAMNRIGQQAEARERRAIGLLAGTGTLTVALGVFVSLHTRRLLRPLARVTERARAVARGDLTPQEPLATDDEIGDLSVAFEGMVEGVARAQSLAVSNERFAAIGKMAAHVTHEIRNPLSSISLNIELLEEELGKEPELRQHEETRALVSSVTREIGRLEQLSEEYLRLARLPQPRMEADDIVSLVREIAQFVGPEMQRASCSLALHVPDSLPSVLFDEAQIRQALLNLLRNAREAMSEGGIIDVRLTGEGMGVVISVSDRGAGIPEEIRARVFDPFFSTKGEGTGLGLAITRQILEAHGGSVSCAPREGGGTSFQLSLPLAPARASLGRV